MSASTQGPVPLRGWTVGATGLLTAVMTVVCMLAVGSSGGPLAVNVVAALPLVSGAVWYLFGSNTYRLGGAMIVGSIAGYCSFWALLAMAITIAT